jgi:hypothetical protein
MSRKRGNKTCDPLSTKSIFMQAELTISISSSTNILAQDILTRSADKLLSEERVKFVKILKSEAGYAEFLEIIDTTCSNKFVGMKEFFQSYLRVSELYDGTVSNTHHLAFPEQHLLLEMFVGASYNRKFPVKDASDVLIYSILDLYYEYVRSDSKLKLPFITRNDREYLGRGVTEFALSGKVSMTIVDKLALEALDEFFFYAFPKYLLFKGKAKSQRFIESHASKQKAPQFYENIFLGDFLSDVYSSSPVSSPLVSRSRLKVAKVCL